MGQLAPLAEMVCQACLAYRAHLVSPSCFSLVLRLRCDRDFRTVMILEGVMILLIGEVARILGAPGSEPCCHRLMTRVVRALTHK